MLVRFDRFKKSRFGCEKNSFLSGHSALFHFFLRTAGANFEQKYSRIDFERVLFCIFFRLYILLYQQQYTSLPSRQTLTCLPAGSEVQKGVCIYGLPSSACICIPPVGHTAVLLLVLMISSDDLCKTCKTDPRWGDPCDG